MLTRIKNWYHTQIDLSYAVSEARRANGWSWWTRENSTGVTLGLGAVICLAFAVYATDTRVAAIAGGVAAFLYFATLAAMWRTDNRLARAWRAEHPPQGTGTPAIDMMRDEARTFHEKQLSNIAAVDGAGGLLRTAFWIVHYALLVVVFIVVTILCIDVISPNSPQPGWSHGPVLVAATLWAVEAVIAHLARKRATRPAAAPA